MGMIGNFLLLDDATVRSLLENPETIHGLLDESVYEVDPATGYVDVGKAWHGLHFLLAGSAWGGEPPLDFIVSGGTPVGEEDVGYGPARALRASQVATLAEALAGITKDTLIARFDGAKMDQLEIYPQGGWKGVNPRDQETFRYFMGAYEEIAALVQEGAATGKGLLVWMS